MLAGPYFDLHLFRGACNAACLYSSWVYNLFQRFYFLREFLNPFFLIAVFEATPCHDGGGYTDSSNNKSLPLVVFTVS